MIDCVSMLLDKNSLILCNVGMESSQWALEILFCSMTSQL